MINLLLNLNRRNKLLWIHLIIKYYFSDENEGEKAELPGLNDDSDTETEPEDKKTFLK